MTRAFTSIFLLMMPMVSGLAQVLNKKGESIRPAYISFNTPLPTSVEDVAGEFLHISYLDRIGKSEEITLVLENVDRSFVRELRLIKQFGQNYFDINLKDHGLQLSVETSYFCFLTNENGETRKRTIRYLAKIRKDIVATIIVSPKYLSCGDPTGANLVEFYGQVDGGQAPYRVNWYVLNARRSDFLYEPANLMVPTASEVSSIQVDKSPEYYVLLHVTDACGNEQIATVQVICDDNEGKVNTLFLEKVDNLILYGDERVK